MVGWGHESAADRLDAALPDPRLRQPDRCTVQGGDGGRPDRATDRPGGNRHKPRCARRGKHHRSLGTRLDDTGARRFGVLGGEGGRHQRATRRRRDGAGPKTGRARQRNPAGPAPLRPPGGAPRPCRGGGGEPGRAGPLLAGRAHPRVRTFRDLARLRHAAAPARTERGTCRAVRGIRTGPGGGPQRRSGAGHRPRGTGRARRGRDHRRPAGRPGPWAGGLADQADQHHGPAGVGEPDEP